MRASFLLFLLIINAYSIDAQDYSLIGKAVPDFTLTDVDYYNSKTFNPEQTKGKWLILDFWAKTCISCVKSFPKINTLQKEFKDRVQFLLVGINDQTYNRNIDLVYEQYRKTMKLDLAIAYDSVLFRQFKVQAVPLVVIVDPEKKVYAVTGGHELTSENLTKIISGEEIVMVKHDIEVSTKQETIKDWNQSTDDHILYRTVLSTYKGEPVTAGLPFDTLQGKVFVMRSTLGQLYNLAYLGREAASIRGIFLTHWRYPLLELKDTTAFVYDYSTNRGFYNYSLDMGRQHVSDSALMITIQHDLRNHFGYSISMETREMPCWELKATKAAKLKLKSTSNTYRGDAGPAGIINGKKMTIESLLDMIQMYNEKETLPFIDHTGIEGFINIDLRAAMIDLNDVIRSLGSHGLILQKRFHPMKVLVVRDKS